MSHKQHRHGEILYVSKNGNNLTAKKGNPEKPWTDPWAAKSVAVSGDIIHVFPGDWTWGDVGSGADVESDGTLTDSLWKDGITYYFEDGAVITNISVTTFRSLVYVDPDYVGHQKFQILGNGEFKSTSTIQYQPLFDFAESAGSLTYDFKLEAKNITINEGGLATFRFGARDITIDIDYFDSKYMWQHINYTGVTDDTFDDDTILNCKIGTWNLHPTNTTGKYQCLLYVQHRRYGVFNVDVGTIYAVTNGTGLLLGVGSARKHVEACSINVNAGAIFFKDLGIETAAYSDFTYTESITSIDDNLPLNGTRLNGLIRLYGQLGQGTHHFRDNSMNINIGSIHGPLAAGGYLNLEDDVTYPSKFVTNNTLNINVGTINTGGYNHPVASVNLYGAGSNTPAVDRIHVTINVSNGVTALGPAIWLSQDNRIGTVTFSGRYKTQEASMETLGYDPDTSVSIYQLKDCVLINDGTNAITGSINGTDTITINVMDGVYSNGGAVDANVTQQVSTLTASSNIN